MLSFIYGVVKKGQELGERIRVDKETTRDYGQRLEERNKTKEEQKEMNYHVDMLWHKP